MHLRDHLHFVSRSCDIFDRVVAPLTSDLLQRPATAWVHCAGLKTQWSRSRLCPFYKERVVKAGKSFPALTGGTRTPYL